MSPLPASAGANLADDTNAMAPIGDLATNYLDDHPDLADRIRLQRQSVSQGEDLQETHHRASQRLLGDVQDARTNLAETKLGPKVKGGGRGPAHPEAVERAQRAYDEAVRVKAEHDAKGRSLLQGIGADRELLRQMNRLVDQQARAHAETEVLSDIVMPDGNFLDILKSSVSTRALLLAERRATIDAPEPEDVVRDRVLLKELPEDDGFGIPPLSYRKNREGFSWPVAAVHGAAPSDAPDAGIPHIIDLKPFVMRLGRDLLRDHITKSVREHYAALDVTPLSDEERATKLADIEVQLAEAERIEVEATWAARAAGHYVPFRADVNVRTVLGIE